MVRSDPRPISPKDIKHGRALFSFYMHVSRVSLASDYVPKIIGIDPVIIAGTEVRSAIVITEKNYGLLLRQDERQPV